MNVADPNPDDNPSSDANQTPQQICRQIDQFAETLKSKVEEAARAGDSFDSLEREIHKMILSVGRQAVDLFVSLQGDGDLGDALTTQDGATLHRSANKTGSTIRSIFGTHHFEQFTYAPGPKKAIALRPISARMSLPSVRWSYLLQQCGSPGLVDPRKPACKKLAPLVPDRYAALQANCAGDSRATRSQPPTKNCRIEALDARSRVGTLNGTPAWPRHN